MIKLIIRIIVCSLFIFSIANAQNEYRYSLNLNNVENDALSVELMAPKLKNNVAVFSFAKIVPGTYAISDYGKFISRLRAFDNAGKELPVTKISTDKWKISKANSLSKISYTVEDIFDSEIKHGIYPMAATNIEAGKDFVINTPGFFGFFEENRRLPFTITITKPDSLYASTSLVPAEETTVKDVFKTASADALYDSPIMYTVPDTTTVMVGNCRVLVSVYSPGKLENSKQIARWMSNLLEAARLYLGGRIPTDKYTFLYYFKDPKVKHSFPAGLGGALEHTTSSFYYFPDASEAFLKNTIVHASSHEFFHIITPLTIASKEVKEFNFDEPVLSKHLWLYEGVTEYTSNHVQVKYGLETVPEYLGILSDKITNSRSNYNDTLPFTVLSKEAAGEYASQYDNVYEKGALIAACLDIYLLQLSGGTYSLRNLTYDLGVRFGKKRYFNDDELFSEITDLTYPEIGDFLKKYVSGSEAIPYEYYFGLAGIKLTQKSQKKIFSLGGIAPGTSANGVVTVSQQSRFNAFGKKVGYKTDDEWYTINGVKLTPQDLSHTIDSIKSNMKEGDDFAVKVGRKNKAGKIDTLTLKTKVVALTQPQLNKLERDPDASDQQKKIQHAWLSPENNITGTVPAAKPADVSTVESIIKATYDVISGPAGPRDWKRFNSLFLADAKMGAVSNSASAKGKFRSFTPADYQRGNAPFFLESGFYEEELNRTTSQFGNIAVIASSYQFRMQPAGKVEQRGINYFTLVYSEGRWWISNLSWQDEDEKNKLPELMEKK